MEADPSEGDRLNLPDLEIKAKRKMKTPSQLEMLEKTYAVEAYPSDTLRAELSEKLGLSDRQLQMWFCHRRLKDRKPPSTRRPRKDGCMVLALSPGIAMAHKRPFVVEEAAAGEVRSGYSGAGLSPFVHVDPQPVFPRVGAAVARMPGDMTATNSYYEPPQSLIELRAIAFVEAQLGEPLRDDGPILGMVFDPLPPDAFGAPIVSLVEHNQAGGKAYEPKIYERPDNKLSKGSVRAVHEYQFLPEQPSARADAMEKIAPSCYYGSPSDGSISRIQSISAGHSFLQGNDQLPPGYGFQAQIPNINQFPQQSKQAHVLANPSEECESISRKNSFLNINADSHLGSQPLGLDSSYVSPDPNESLDDVPRMVRKRKTEEARLAKEVESQEKRMRKELEKQDILRRKREEQMRKEMERQDRERRKEEERLLREKQREEDRYQREQRRELERRERFLQKESLRAEKVRQKEEVRREKEATRLKAANDKAVARKLAKESMELIEDERLELMELAAANSGLPSILLLDSETLQNIESFRDLMDSFPPKSVKMTKPFSVQPWNLEENMGNLFMVWRFFITFADVIGVWPFTLDEFVQSLHDFDPRLLGEVHIALLNLIIKDIEDVSQATSTGLWVTQISYSNPVGGHLQVVEGAYCWGFDISHWKRHLNLLTWPEILRQFALSAGFGPTLRKNIKQAYPQDDYDGIDGEDVVSNLRSGLAAENAVAKMQEKGFSSLRRSRHRLTPGTVKFAAFHILSIEGEKGLTILEVANKIQRSGLRDLSTSKTPEASIAAALSRDSKLFERVAPSTYCVRSPYRKDTTDADAVLHSAREKVQIWKNGFYEGEEADDPERDDDYESDVGEEAEVDGLGAELGYVVSRTGPMSDMQIENNITGDYIAEASSSGLLAAGEGLASVNTEYLKRDINDSGFADNSVDVSGMCVEASNFEQDDTIVDESNPGEPWVRGLSEGEYSDLSVEERLNVLVALIGLSIGGRSIRLVLEERLEAANSLKKQMRAEAQLDRRRIKEEYTKIQYSSFTVDRTDAILPVAELRQSPLDMGCKIGETTISTIGYEDISAGLQSDRSHLDNFHEERNLIELDYVPEASASRPPGPSRSQLKSFIGHRAEELYVHRSLPLGQDRRRNRYWQFVVSASLSDPGCGRIFVELCNGNWRLIDSEEGFDALLSSLDTRGVREYHLHAMLLKIEELFRKTLRSKFIQNNKSLKEEESFSICDFGNVFTSDHSHSSVAETPTSFIIENGKNETQNDSILKRHRNFDEWMWQECSNFSKLGAVKYGESRCPLVVSSCDVCHDLYFYEYKHCPSCHNTYSTCDGIFNFSEHISQCQERRSLESGCGVIGYKDQSPSRIRLLKHILALIEASIQPDALNSEWTWSYRRSWGMKISASSLTEHLLQGLTLLEIAVRRDFLSSNFETTSELLNSLNLPPITTNDGSCETVHVLPWLPCTSAAIAFRLMQLDAAICYSPNQKPDSQSEHEAITFLGHPSEYAVVKNMQEDEIAECLQEDECFRDEGCWSGMANGNISFGRRRGTRGGRGRGRGGGRWSQRRGVSVGHRPESLTRRGAVNGSYLHQDIVWKKRSRGRGGSRRGRRNARGSLGPRNAAVGMGRYTPGELKPDDDWEGDESQRVDRGGELAENVSSDRSEFEYENGHIMGDDEYDDDEFMADEYTRVFDDGMGGQGRVAAASEMDELDIDDQDEEQDEDDDMGDEYINDELDDEEDERDAGGSMDEEDTCSEYSE